jgi:threonylcarbamoyladenosine tRNA methylthiotransferase MtaB
VPEPRRVAFATLGCKLNQHDTAELQALLTARGYEVVPFEAEAQLYVVNTCTVTARADRSDRQAIRQAAARNPGARIVVTGCYAQTSPGAVAGLPGVDLVLGTSERHRLPDLLDELPPPDGRPGTGPPPRPRIEVREVFEATRRQPLPVIPLHRFARGYTRAFVKVQDGCQHRCGFCIVPFARGASRSQPAEVVVEHVTALVAGGYREVVLTGVDLGHYGWDIVPRTTLAALVRRLLDVPGLGRLRLSSILPAYFTPELVELVVGERRICRHHHVPLQSGSDRVLRAMRRPYHAALYRRLVERLAEGIPGLALGTDVITGFPGETGEEFEETEALLGSLPFSYLHVFSYSDRPGTESARSPAPRVAAPEVRRRTASLRRLSATRQAAFRRAQVGTVVEALVLEERRGRDGSLVGLTDNYVEVAFPGPATLGGRTCRVRVTGEAGEQLVGDLAGPPAASLSLARG